MNNTKKICYIATLTALYVVLSAFLKFNIIGNIQVDLGYIAFIVAICYFNVYGTIVGVLGCSLESILFSAYGFSISWAFSNFIIGIICGLVFEKTKNKIYRVCSIIGSSILGLLFVKTFIELYLYSIPFAVKIPKNAVACIIDCITMIIGYIFYNRYNNIICGIDK